MAYTKTIWVNDNEPDIDADNLNKMEQGIYDGQLNAEWGHITGSLENQPEIPSIGGEAENNISFIHTPNNYYDSVEKTEDKKLNSTGTALEDAEGFNTTDFIKVVSGNTYEYDAEGLTEGEVVWEYNANKEPIQSTALTSHNQVITMTSNTKYVRLSVGTYYYMVDTPLIQNKIVVDNETFTETIKVGTEVDDKSKVNVLHSKNLFDKNTMVLDGINISSSTGAVQSATNNASILIKVKPNTIYTLSKTAGARFVAGTYPTVPIAGTTTLSNYIANNSGSSITITTGASDNYLIAWVWYGNGDTLTEAEMINSVQVEEGSVATSYEPYVVPSINVDGETIYQAPVVLWTNPSPTSSFAGQEITLNDDIGNYSYYEILYLFSSGSESDIELTTGRIETSKRAFLSALASVNNSIAAHRRLVTSLNNNKITFSVGQTITTSVITNNNILIPYKILGYK